MKKYIIGYILGAVVTIVIIKFGLICGMLLSMIGPFVADMCSSKEDKTE